MTPREIRKAHNEALFRELNDQIAALASSSPAAGDLRLICECWSLDCESTVLVPGAQYEDVRRHPLRFLIHDGHQDPEIEEVVGQHGSFIVVEKHADVAPALA